MFTRTRTVLQSSRSTQRPLPLLCESVLDTIGKTPLVRLDRLCQALGLKNTTNTTNNNSNKDASPPPTILAKLEHLNPGMSKKDRIAYEIIRQAKSSGQLQEGQPVVELTSGNTGTGLAIVCPPLGHSFCAVMSKGNSKERAQMMHMLGAEVILVPQAESSISCQGGGGGGGGGGVSGEDLALVEEQTQKICAERNAFRVDQFHRQGNFDAHYYGTALEILEQTRNVVQIDGFCDFVGTGGSFAGCTQRFKEEIGSDKVASFILEPAGVHPLADKYGSNTSTTTTLSSGSSKTAQEQLVQSKNHVIQGGGYDMDDLTFIDQVIQNGYVDGYMEVTNEQATSMARLLAKTEGIFGGFSAGANIFGAAEMIRQGKAKNVVVLVCDSGSKYYSANLLPALED